MAERDECVRVIRDHFRLFAEETGRWRSFLLRNRVNASTFPERAANRIRDFHLLLNQGHSGLLREVFAEEVSLEMLQNSREVYSKLIRCARFHWFGLEWIRFLVFTYGPRYSDWPSYVAERSASKREQARCRVYGYLLSEYQVRGLTPPWSPIESAGNGRYEPVFEPPPIMQLPVIISAPPQQPEPSYPIVPVDPPAFVAEVVEPQDPDVDPDLIKFRPGVITGPVDIVSPDRRFVDEETVALSLRKLDFFSMQDVPKMLVYPSVEDHPFFHLITRPAEPEFQQQQYPPLPPHADPAMGAIVKAIEAGNPVTVISPQLEVLQERWRLFFRQMIEQLRPMIEPPVNQKGDAEPVQDPAPVTPITPRREPLSFPVMGPETGREVGAPEFGEIRAARGRARSNAFRLMTREELDNVHAYCIFQYQKSPYFVSGRTTSLSIPAGTFRLLLKNHSRMRLTLASLKLTLRCGEDTHVILDGGTSYYREPRVINFDILRPGQLDVCIRSRAHVAMFNALTVVFASWKLYCLTPE